ncbi:hypothetical protein ACET3Z_005052 [Daucus carota]
MDKSGECCKERKRWKPNILSFDEVVQEAVVVGQEAGEAVKENISEVEATVNASIAEIAVNEPEVTVSEIVVSRTKDAIMETTVNFSTVDERVPMETEDVVTEATVDEEIPMETEATVNQSTPTETETIVEPVTFIEEIMKEIEDTVLSTIMNFKFSRRKTFKEFIQEKGARRTKRLKGFRNKKKPKVFMKKFHAKTDAMPIQGIIENSFDGMKRHMTAQIREAGIEYDKVRNFVCFKLHHPSIDGHVNQTKFHENFKNNREADTRSIYFFELMMMIEILEDDDTITPEMLKPISDYYDLRERQYKDIYGDWRFHDNSYYLNPVEEEQVDVAPHEVN